MNLCESTLAFGRAEEPPPRLAQVALAEIVSDVIEGERLAVGDEDVSYGEDIPAGLVLRADPEQLYRVLANLLRNARQAIAASGKPGELLVAGRETDDAWTITVMDTGPGLPLKRANIFLRRFRAARAKAVLVSGLRFRRNSSVGMVAS